MCQLSNAQNSSVYVFCLFVVVVVVVVVVV